MRLYLALPRTQPVEAISPSASPLDLAVFPFEYPAYGSAIICRYVCSGHLLPMLRPGSFLLRNSFLHFLGLSVTRPPLLPHIGEAPDAGWPHSRAGYATQAALPLEVWYGPWKRKNSSLPLKLLILISQTRRTLAPQENLRTHWRAELWDEERLNPNDTLEAWIQRCLKPPFLKFPIKRTKYTINLSLLD